MVGGLVCDWFNYKTWGGIWKQTDLMQVLKTIGFQWIRAWVTTRSSDDLRRTDPAQWGTVLPWKSEFWSSVEIAERILHEAQDKGFHLDLVLFLSHRAAHAGTQDAPPEWAGRSVSETASLLEDYTYRTVSYYRGRGLNIELYEIGNEIEWGILNFRPGERIPIPPGVDRTADMGYMSSNVWNVEAVLLKSAIAGVKRADPGAKIVLHIDTIAYSPGDLIARTFFQTMIGQEVAFDYAGLSLPYPSPGWWPQYYSSRLWYERVLLVVEHLRQLGKRVIFCEGNYPNRPDSIPGPPMQDYPFSPEGQAKWVRELLVFLTNQDNVAGFSYWYPEYFPGMGGTDPNSGNVQSTGLFATETEIRPALREFRRMLGP
jgi:arabinogalactan endo-1,4-beta-galactosidase